MSVYDIIEKISTVTRIYHKKRYNPDFIVAKFYINNKEINYYYRDYSKEKLFMHMKSKMYSQKLIKKDFWDPEFCNIENLFKEDIDDVIASIDYKLEREDTKDRKIVVGFLITLINLYDILYKSFIVVNYHKVIDENFNKGKNLLKKVFNQIDIVIDFSYSMIKLIKSLYTEDDITNFLVTPSGKFRLSVRDLPFILEGTPKVHEISQLIFNSVSDKTEVLKYYKELLGICGRIYTPKVIKSFISENVILNILKLNVNLDIYENAIINLISLYIDKGGSMDIQFDFDFSSTSSYQNIIPLIDMIREYRLS